MDSAEKTAIAEQQAAKKAARRAAFIQEVAEATAMLVCGPGTPRGPFAQAHHEQQMSEWRALNAREAEEQGLHWAIEQGLLPDGAIELPSAEKQRQLLQTRTYIVMGAAPREGVSS